MFVLQFCTRVPFLEILKLPTTRVPSVFRRSTILYRCVCSISRLPHGIDPRSTFVRGLADTHAQQTGCLFSFEVPHFLFCFCLFSGQVVGDAVSPSPGSFCSRCSVCSATQCNATHCSAARFSTAVARRPRRALDLAAGEVGIDEQGTKGGPFLQQSSVKRRRPCLACRSCLNTWAPTFVHPLKHSSNP